MRFEYIFLNHCIHEKMAQNKLNLVHIKLTEQLIEMIDEEVEKGVYKSRTDFITTAIRNHLEYCRLKEKGYQTFTLPAQPQSEPREKNSS